jgi:hypothetical protein
MIKASFCVFRTNMGADIFSFTPNFFRLSIKMLDRKPKLTILAKSLFLRFHPNCERNPFREWVLKDRLKAMVSLFY